MKTLTYACASVSNFESLPPEFVQNIDFQCEVVKLNPKIAETLKYNFEVAKTLMTYHPETFQSICKKLEGKDIPILFSIYPGIYRQLTETQRKLLSHEELLEGLQTNGEILEYYPEKYKKNRDVCLIAISNNPKAFTHCDESLRKDRKFMLEFIERHPGDFREHIASNNEYDDEIALLAVKKFGSNIMYLPKLLKENRIFILEALKSDCTLLIQPNYKIVLSKIKDGYLEVVKVNGTALRYVPQQYQSDEVVRAALHQNPMAIQYCDRKYREDKKIIIEAIKRNGLALEWSDVKQTLEMAQLAIGNTGKAIEHVSKDILDDNEFLIYEALKTYKEAVKYSSERFRKNISKMKKAINISGISLKYASDELRNDKEFVIDAIRMDGEAYHFVHPDLKFDKDVLFEFSKNPSPIGLLHAAKYISQDKDMIMEVIKKTPLIFRYCDIKYVIDKEVQWSSKKYFKCIRVVPCRDVFFRFK